MSSTNVSNATFKVADLEVELLDASKLQPKSDPTNLTIGTSYTDYMFEASWDVSEGWSKPKISPVHELSVSPGAKSFHYGIEIFEAFKVYRGVDGKLRYFRAESHVKRFLAAAERLCLPQFNVNEFLECITRLLMLEQEWMPVGKTSSLYIRPVFIATDPTLWITVSKKALLYVLLCPMTPYDAPGWDRPYSVSADPQYVRAWPGGSGDMKFGGNYGRTVRFIAMAGKEGYDCLLWLFGEDHKLTEVGHMNVFFLMENESGEKELVTPPLNSLILPGVTRQSVLDLTREWNEFKVSEREITMKEVVQANNENRLLEVFGTATLTTITPVGRIHYEGKDHEIPTVKQTNPLYKKLFESLADIFYARVSHPWAVEI